MVVVARRKLRTRRPKQGKTAARTTGLETLTTGGGLDDDENDDDEEENEAEGGRQGAGDGNLDAAGNLD